MDNINLSIQSKEKILELINDYNQFKEEEILNILNNKNCDLELVKYILFYQDNVSKEVIKQIILNYKIDQVVLSFIIRRKDCSIELLQGCINKYLKLKKEKNINESEIFDDIIQVFKPVQNDNIDNLKKLAKESFKIIVSSKNCTKENIESIKKCEYFSEDFIKDFIYSDQYNQKSLELIIESMKLSIDLLKKIIKSDILNTSLLAKIIANSNEDVLNDLFEIILKSENKYAKNIELFFTNNDSFKLNDKVLDLLIESKILNFFSEKALINILNQNVNISNNLIENITESPKCNSNIIKKILEKNKNLSEKSLENIVSNKNINKENLELLLKSQNNLTKSILKKILSSKCLSIDLLTYIILNNEVPEEFLIKTISRPEFANDRKELIEYIKLFQNDEKFINERKNFLIRNDPKQIIKLMEKSKNFTKFIENDLPKTTNTKKAFYNNFKNKEILFNKKYENNDSNRIPLSTIFTTQLIDPFPSSPDKQDLIIRLITKIDNINNSSIKGSPEGLAVLKLDLLDELKSLELSHKEHIQDCFKNHPKLLVGLNAYSEGLDIGDLINSTTKLTKEEIEELNSTNNQDKTINASHIDNPLNSSTSYVQRENNRKSNSSSNSNSNNYPN